MTTMTLVTHALPVAQWAATVGIYITNATHLVTHSPPLAVILRGIQGTHGIARRIRYQTVRVVSILPAGLCVGPTQPRGVATF
jgi:hypothetical protein